MEFDILGAATLVKAVDNETRRDIISILMRSNKPIEATRICNMVGIKNPSTGTSHLKVLFNAGLVKYKRSGRNILYYPEKDRINKLIECIKTINGID